MYSPPLIASPSCKVKSVLLSTPPASRLILLVRGSGLRQQHLITLRVCVVERAVAEVQARRDRADGVFVGVGAGYVPLVELVGHIVCTHGIAVVNRAHKREVPACGTRSCGGVSQERRGRGGRRVH